jgi:hypothetical protein
MAGHGANVRSGYVDVHNWQSLYDRFSRLTGRSLETSGCLFLAET